MLQSHSVGSRLGVYRAVEGTVRRILSSDALSQIADVRDDETECKNPTLHTSGQDTSQLNGSGATRFHASCLLHISDVELVSEQRRSFQVGTLKDGEPVFLCRPPLCVAAGGLVS